MKYKFLYYIYNDDHELMRVVKSRIDAKLLCKIRPDWHIVAKKVFIKQELFEDAPF